MRYFILFLLVVIQGFYSFIEASVLDTFSLNYPYTQYTTKDGLPSNETYCVFQDSKGIIWIGTDRGLVKYNGYEFKTYTTLDGLTDNVILAINEDNKGNIWYTGLNNIQLGYIDTNMNFHKYSYYQEIRNCMNKINLPRIHFNRIYFEGSDIYLVNNRFGYIIVNDKGVKFIDIRTPGVYDSTFIFQETRKDWSFIYSYFGLLSRKNGPVYINNLSDKPLYRFIKREFRDIYPTLLKNDGIDYIYDGCDKFIVKDSVVEHWRSMDKCSAFQLDENQFIYSTYRNDDRNSIIYYSNSPNIKDRKIKMPFGGRVANAIKDFNGGIWISTLRQGVVYVPGLSTKVSNVLVPIEALLPINELLILENKFKRYTYKVGSNIGIEQIDLLDFNLLSNSSEKNSFYGTVGFKSDYEVDYRITESDAVVKFRNITAVKGAQLISDSIAVLWASGYFYKCNFKKKNKKISWENISFKIPRQESLYCYNLDSCLYGTAEGLYLYQKNKITKSQIRNEKPIKHLEYFKQNDILVYIPLGEGLFLRNNQTEETIHLTTEDGLASNTINSVYMDSAQVLWIGTNRGINSLRLDSNNSYYLETLLKGEKTLSSPNILQIYHRDSTLYL